jgi:enoyl-CoA hydratase
VEPVLATHERQILTITLNRPGRLNAVSAPLYRQVIDHLDEAEKDPDTRAVVIAGAGRAFCVGADLKAHDAGSRTPAEVREYVELGQRVCERIQDVAVPVIAAVHGYALGAGAEIATSADFLVIEESAQMGFPEVSIGTFVGGGVTRRLPRLIGLRRSTELLVLGERFTGRQSYDWGLAFRAVPEGTARNEAMSLAATLATKAPQSLARMKAALARTDSSTETFRQEAEDLLAIMGTRDWAEGVRAFAGRRTPNFEGR